MRKALKRCFKQMFKDGFIGKHRHHFAAICDDNAAARAILDRATVDGKIGVILSGMDCDCSQYHREYVADSWTSVAAFKRHWDEHCNWLDGPESQHFVRPDEVEPRHLSRDLALMAYEEGHISVVYPVGLDEMHPVG